MRDHVTTGTFNKLEGHRDISVPSYLAQGQLDVRKLLLEGFIHVLLQVRWFHVLNNCRLQRQKTNRHVSVNQRYREDLQLFLMNHLHGSFHTHAGGDLVTLST